MHPVVQIVAVPQGLHQSLHFGVTMDASERNVFYHRSERLACNHELCPSVNSALRSSPSVLQRPRNCSELREVKLLAKRNSKEVGDIVVQ